MKKPTHVEKLTLQCPGWLIIFFLLSLNKITKLVFVNHITLNDIHLNLNVKRITLNPILLLLKLLLQATIADPYCFCPDYCLHQNAILQLLAIKGCTFTCQHCIHTHSSQNSIDHSDLQRTKSVVFVVKDEDLTKILASQLSSILINKECLCNQSSIHQRTEHPPLNSLQICIKT